MVNGHIVGLFSCIALEDSCNTAKITQLKAHITYVIVLLYHALAKVVLADRSLNYVHTVPVTNTNELDLGPSR